MKLGELAALIRSKNAGPFCLTFDIMFAREEEYLRVKQAAVIDRTAFARLYGTDVDDVKLFVCDSALAFKLSIPRPNIQGDFGDADLHGGQQYAPLLDIEVPDE